MRIVPVSAGQNEWEWISVRVGGIGYRELGLVNGDGEVGKEKSRMRGSSGGMVMYMESESCNSSSCVIPSASDGT